MKKSFGGLINKLTSSGRLDAGVLKDDMDDENDPHFRKDATLETTHDVDRSEEFKFKKSFSFKGLSPFKPQEASLEGDNGFAKRKSSSMRNMPDTQKLDKEKLHESDDKFIKKSFSLRGVPSVFSKSPEAKTPEPLRSPSSLKNLFSPSQYEQHYDFNVADESDEESSSEEEEGEEAQAVVPTKASRRPRVNSTYDDFDDARPKPLAASAPAFTNAPASPAAFAKTPTSPLALAPPPSSPPRWQASPPKVPSSPPVPASFASSPPRAQAAPSPRLQERPPALVTDDIEAQFGRMRSDSTTSDDDMLITSNGGSPMSLFNPFSSKARKLK